MSDQRPGSATGLRLFVAIDLPRPVSATLGSWQDDVLAGRGALRTIEPARLHLTLAFLGSCEPAELPAIEAACNAVAGFPVGGLALGEPAWLPRRRPNVLAIRIEDDRGELRDAQSVLAGALVTAGVLEAAGRAFFPHVTAARVRRGERVRAAPLPPPAPLEFSAATVTLQRSHLEVGGARYEALHQVPLAGG